jgi:hypothetical protein
MYDARLGRFLSIDPHEKNYPNITPYAFVNNMPIWAIDIDGKDIIILSYGKSEPGHGLGHQAMLIGNDKDGWKFYSKDGDASYTNPDGSHNDNYTIKGFKTLDEFTNSEYNTFKDDYDDKQGTKNSEKDD